MSEIFIYPEEKDNALIRRAFEQSLKYMHQEDNVQVELSIVSPEEIREVNREMRGVDAVTDVLSFPTLELNERRAVAEDFPDDVDPDTGNLMIGEVLICIERATEQAHEYGHSVERELGYLTVHAMMHLFGYDHMVDEDKVRMRHAEEEIMNALGLVRE